MSLRSLCPLCARCFLHIGVLILFHGSVFYPRYKDFHDLQVETSCSYPDLVKEELQKYDIGVCKYFQVDRKPAQVNNNKQHATTPVGMN